jgi:hypothetical protein
MFFANFLFDLLPFNAEWWIGQHVIELFVRVTILRQCVASNGDILPLDQHVRLADRIGLVVYLFPEHGKAGLRVQLCEIFVRDRKHPSRPRSWVIDGSDDAGFGQHIVILDKQKINHEADDFARRKMFTSRFIRQFGELADQLFKGKSHLAVADNIRVQVDPSKLLNDLIEQIAFGELLNLCGEIKSLENVAGGRENACT